MNYEILTVGNGWILRGASHDGKLDSSSDTFIFYTIDEMAKWLKEREKAEKERNM